MARTSLLLEMERDAEIAQAGEAVTKLTPASAQAKVLDLVFVVAGSIRVQ